jgi:hypothetical protein
MSSPADINKDKDFCISSSPLKIYVHAVWSERFMAVSINAIIL